MVIALGTVGAGLPAGLRAEVAGLPVILVALDADPDINGKPGSGAGPAAVKKWLAAFRQARFWPVPSGKDPGHYAELGGNLRSWVNIGLAPDISASKNELPLSPVRLTVGEGGKEKIEPQQPEVEGVPGLKWCRICFGNKFLHGDAGGYFCVNCVPYDKPGRVVLATVPIGENVVD